MRRVILAVVAVFLAWSLMDFVIHGVILSSSYASTPSLWRPMNEMKMNVMYLSVLITAVCFVLVYVLFFARRGISIGLRYGVLFGVGAGVSIQHLFHFSATHGSLAISLQQNFDLLDGEPLV